MSQPWEDFGGGTAVAEKPPWEEFSAAPWQEFKKEKTIPQEIAAGFKRGQELVAPFTTDVMKVPGQMVSRIADYIFPSKQPLVQPEQIKALTTGLTGGVEVPGSVSDVVQNWIAQQGSGLTTGPNLAAMALAPAAPGPIGAYFMGTAVEQTPQAAQQLYQGVTQKQPDEALMGTLNLLAGIGIPVGIAKGLARPAPTSGITAADIPTEKQMMSTGVRSSMQDVPIIGAPPPQQMPIIAPGMPTLAEQIRAAMMQNQIVPAVQAAGEPKLGGQISFAAPAEAGAVPSARQAASGKAPPLQDLRPAVRTMSGEKVEGVKGQIHDEIIKENQIPATDIDRRIFTDAQGKELSREQVAAMGVPETGPTPGAHADALAEVQGAPIPPTATPPPAPSRSMIEPDLQPGKGLQVKFDPKEGIGATPNQQSIDYFGFQKTMTPDEFISLATERKMESTAPGIEKALREGKSVSPPFLDVEWDAAQKVWRVMSHEGRNRSEAIRAINPDTQMPVHLFPRGGLRGRDLTPEMKSAPILPEKGAKKQGLQVKVNPRAGEAGGIPMDFFEDAVKKTKEGAKILSEKATTYANKWAGWSAPRTVTANENVGNALVHYAVADEAGRAIGKSEATKVLAERYKDPQFSRTMGAAIVQDTLNTIRQQHINAGETDLAARVTRKYEPELRKAMADPEMKAAIERHKATIQKQAQEYHTELGGKLARGGEETGAFMNLRAILNTEEPADVNAFVYGSRRGDVTAPLRRGSVFSKERKGTGQDYEVDYRTLAERMLRGNYREAMKKRWFDSYVESGLGVVLPTGKTPPEIGGKPAVKIPIVRKTFEKRTGEMAYKSENLWVRSDLAAEARQALQTDSPPHKAGLSMALDLATDLQLIGPTDFIFHTANMYSSIAGGVGAKTGLGEHIRSVVGLRQLDAVARIAHESYRAMMDTPDVQAAWAEISRIGAGREYPAHHGLISRGIEKAGLEKTPVRWLDPQYISSRAIQALDKAARLTKNDMFDNLVKRGLVENNELNRREFINQMGQYHNALVSKFQQFAKDYRISPFVTAGRTFNRLGAQRLMGDPGVRAANASAAVKLRYFQYLKLFSTMVGATVGLNYMFTGKPFGRPGTQPWRVDTGMDDQDGKHITLDLAKDLLVSRGLRVTGTGALIEGIARDESAGDIAKRAGSDIFSSLLHPWEGPIVRTAEIAKFGRTIGGPYVSENPDDFGENIKAAVKNINPTVAAYLTGQEKGGTKGGLKGMTKQLEQAVGIGTARQPTYEQKQEEISQQRFGGKDISADLGRRAVADTLIKRDKPQDLNARVQAGKYITQLEGDSRKRLTKSLSPESQKFLKDNGVLLPGHGLSLNVEGVNVRLSEKETKRYEELLKTAYDKILPRLSANEKFTAMKPWEKSQMITEIGTEINSAVRERLKEEIQSGRLKDEKKKRRSAMYE